MSSDGVRFHWSDYLVFVLSLVLSGLVGVVQGILDQIRSRKAPKKDSGVAEKNISVWPASLSVMASCLAAPFVLGIPAEVYFYGTDFVALALGYLIGVPLVSHLLFARLYNMEVTSVYEYLEYRYSKTIRSLCTFIFAISIIIYLGIITYAPAVAFSQVSGLSMGISILGVGIIGTVYTAIGGLKGVIWVDAIQMLIILVSVLAIVIKGSVNAGGIGSVFRTAYNDGRLKAIPFSLDPLVRHSFWTQTIGGTFMLLVVFTNQSIVQKFLGLPTMKKMYITSYVSMAALVSYFLLFSLAGIVMYAYYAGCDPLMAKKIVKPDQIVLVFVLELFQNIYGVAGLFTAAVFSASLSSFAGGINALAAVTILDVINPLYTKRTGLRQINPRKLVLIFKGLVVFYGLITIGFAFLAPFLGPGLLQLALNLMGVVGAPMLALFIMGVFMPCINSLGACLGLLISLVFMFWLAIGGIFMNAKYQFQLKSLLPRRVDGSCPAERSTSMALPTSVALPTSLPNMSDVLGTGIFQMNVSSEWMLNDTTMSVFQENSSSLVGLLTTELNTTVEPATMPMPFGVELFYMMSYMWYSVIAVLIAVAVAFLVSWCSGFRNKQPVDRNLSFMCCYKESYETEFLDEKNLVTSSKVSLNADGTTSSSNHIHPTTVIQSQMEPELEPENPIPEPFEDYDDTGVYNYGIFRRDRCSRCRRSKIMYCTKF